MYQLDQAISDDNKLDGISSLLRQALASTGKSYDLWPKWSRVVHQIRANPYSNYMVKLTTSLRQEVQEAASESRTYLSTLLETALKLGTLSINDDPGLIIRRSYDYRTISLAYLVNGLITLRLAALRTLCDINTIYNSSESTLSQEYREACVQKWMDIPYLQKVDSDKADVLIAPLFLTLEAATEKEKRYLNDLIDSVRQPLTEKLRNGY
jgi:hypothetical protein